MATNSSLFKFDMQKYIDDFKAAKALAKYNGQSPLIKNQNKEKELYGYITETNKPITTEPIKPIIKPIITLPIEILEPTLTINDITFIKCDKCNIFIPTKQYDKHITSENKN